ncbi:peptidase M15B and M15C DD-carboxypeptidase VanY/endolysin [Trichosporon asahii var. asahii CBS 2479]|uniref:Peptidase M15B and M15C DD-carboxypeptidase VanY/endolysin n=1 Tax=Trichosporon asahii var. asahii (strain ATCC 90039 / CBS 2479 / JCM 2466 / KCTC 7840 / NBRC 103889/ NCYC 2677 / UAMH 7654) TaxID=1186058 RepID=J6EPA2_TRIAS|nr:peptidase M15B and M15C DD-carboxypeptidase VanY/endolysin [Trichosporon asahii var. asahii CBS 2479]EJT46244.1 peptidase M15B and M15C DD-carboxypeptidase VanY/endolysin [Trichosporon asahii var. asahii CBS 2479]
MLLSTLLSFATLALSVVGVPHERRGVGGLDAGAFAGDGAGSRRITALQYLLLDHQAVGVDGIWGPETSDAVQSFQSKSGLEADSIPGPATLGALASVVQQGSKGNAPAGDRRGRHRGKGYVE